MGGVVQILRFVHQQDDSAIAPVESERNVIVKGHKERVRRFGSCFEFTEVSFGEGRELLDDRHWRCVQIAGPQGHGNNWTICFVAGCHQTSGVFPQQGCFPCSGHPLYDDRVPAFAALYAIHGSVEQVDFAFASGEDRGRSPVNGAGKPAKSGLNGRRQLVG